MYVDVKTVRRRLTSVVGTLSLGRKRYQHENNQVIRMAMSKKMNRYFKM